MVGILDNFEIRGSFMVRILDNFDFGHFHFWLEYWTTWNIGVRLWLEYWTTLVLTVFTFGWNTGQLWARLRFWLEYWTTLASGCRFWLEYWTTLKFFAERASRALYFRTTCQEVVQYSNQKWQYKPEVVQKLILKWNRPNPKFSIQTINRSQ